MLAQAILVVLTFVFGCEAFLVGGICTNSSSKPCRLQFTSRRTNGSLIDVVSQPRCRCPGTGMCSNDWTRTDHIISRRLTTDTNTNMTVKMMFCDPIVPRNYCQMGNVSMEVVGAGDVPDSIAAYNCRCRDNRPLVLQRRWIDDQFRRHHEYVCAGLHPTCPSRISQCLVSRGDTVFYHCTCPHAFKCQVEETGWASNNLIGYCTQA